MSAGTSVFRGRDQESFLAVDLTGSAGRALTAVEAQAKTLRFTGTLGASITMRVPLSATENKGYTGVFENQTSGGYTVTVSPITGTGVPVAPGAAVTCWYDGVNFVGQSPAGLAGTVSGISTLFPIVITDPQIGDAIAFDGTQFENVPFSAGGQLVLTPAGNVVLTSEQADFTNIELRSGGGVAAPFTLTFPDKADGRAWIVENTTGQPCTLIGNDGSQSFLVNNARCQVLWDGATLMRQWLSVPTHFNYAGSDPITFSTWDQVDADYIEFTPIAGSVTVNWPTGGSLGKRGRRQTIKNDHTTQWIDVKTSGAGADKTTRLLPGETGSFVIDDSGALVPDWTRAFERRVAVTHDNTATYTVLHPDFLARVLVIGGTLTLTRNLVLPTVAHHSWVVMNQTGQNLVVKTSAGGGVKVIDGNTTWLACDGTDIVALAQPAAAVPLLAQANFTRLIMGNIADWAATGNFSGMRLDVQGDVPTLYMDAKNAASPFRVVPPTSGAQWGTAATDKQSWWDGTPSVQMTHSGATVEAQLDNLLTQMSLRGLIANYVSPLSVSPWLFIDPRNFPGAHNDPVGTLTDSSGSARSATAAGAARGLLQVSSNLSPNGSRTISLDGVDDSYDFTTAMFSMTNGAMYTIAGNFQTNAGAGQVIFTDSGNQRPQLIVETFTTNLYAFRDEGHTFTFGAFAAGWQVLQWVFYPPSGGTGIARLYKNGAQVGSDSVWNWNPVSSTGFIISGGPLPAKCFLGPIIITPGDVTDRTREGLRSWIGAHY